VRPGRNGIVELVRAATVVITADVSGVRTPVGSGFFVAPGWVLTCAHVVRKGSRPRVLWRGKELEPTATRVEHGAPWPDGSFGWPDAAALQVQIPVGEPWVPVVPLAAQPPAPGDEVWAYGISQVRGGAPERDGSTLTVANPAPEDEPGFLKLQPGQLAGGMSGGPVLNLDTYEVCGITKATQDPRSLRGGWAVSIRDALDAVGDGIAALNAEHHADSLRALRAGQLMLGTLPDKVMAHLVDRPGAERILAGYLENEVKLSPPVTVKPEQLGEWVARRLFSLNLDQVYAALLAARDILRKETAISIFDHVVCCLTVGERLGWWVPGEAAETLRSESDKETPRIVWVGTDEDATVCLLLRRMAGAGPVDRLAVGGPASARVDGPSGLPAETCADVEAEIRRQLGVDDEGERGWSRAEIQSLFVDQFRVANIFLQLSVDAGLDASTLRRVADEFPGFRFIIHKRDLDVPDGVDDVVLRLFPAIDKTSEWFGLLTRGRLLHQLGLPSEHRVA
jgi:hypothetical protein